MISSGTKRGLAVVAVSALAVTGVPGIANAVTLEGQQATGVTIRSVVGGETASIANDGKNTTISLVATAADTIDPDGGAGPLAAVNVEFVSFYHGSVAAANLIGTATQSATGEYQLEWTPPIGMSATDIIAVASDSAGTPIGADAATRDTETAVLISGTAPTVEINPTAGDLGYFAQPNDGSGDGAAYTTGNNVAGITGSTSVPAGNPAVVAADSLGVTSGTTAAGAANAAGIRQWVGTVDVAAGALDTDSAVADQILPVVSVGAAALTTRDAQGFSLYKQSIGNITATATPTDPDTNTGDVTVTVLDTQGKPVAGAHVVRENANGGTPTDGLTDGLGQITFTGAAAGSQGYYVDTSDDSGFNTGVDFRTSTTVAAARPDAIAFTSKDGAAFDWDETTQAGDANDLSVKVTDAAGNPLVGQRVFYKWTYAGFESDADGEAGTTAEANGVTGADGTLVIPRPTNASFAGGTVDNLADGGSGGSLTLNAYVNRDGSNPGQDPVDLAMAPQTVKVGEADVAWDAPTETDRTFGTTQTISGSLALVDGTTLAGRTLNVTYAPGTNSALSTTQPAGTTRLSNTTARVITGADGTFGVSLTDPQTNPQAAENGTLTVTGTDTVAVSGGGTKGGIGADETDSVIVHWVADAEPASVNTPTYNNLFTTATPGRPVQVKFKVTNANGDALRGQSVTLKTDHGFFTTDSATAAALVPASAPTAGAAFGVWKNIGSEITVTTDGSGFATATLAIEKDAGFDDDGQVRANVTATAGSITSNGPNSEPISVVFSSVNPLNNGGLDIAQSAKQTVTILPKAPVTETVFYDVHAKDQFGNLVEDDPVNVSTDHGFINTVATGARATVNSAVTDDASAFALGAETAGDATPQGSWTTESTVYVDTDPTTPGFQNVDNGATPQDDRYRATNTNVSAEGETVNFYEIDFANSTYELEHDTANEVKVGTTVIETYTAIDQNGEPMSGVGVEFFRNGPDTQQTGEENEDGITNKDGKASYVFSGTKAGTATIEALITDTNGIAAGGSAVPSSRATDQVVFQGDAIPPKNIGLKVTGASKGKRDIVKANARPIADGAVAILFKNGKRVAQHKLGDNGDHTFRVRDTNGKKKTRYTVKVKATATTKAAKDSVRIR